MATKIQLADVKIDQLVYDSDLIKEIEFHTTDYNFNDKVIRQKISVTTDDNIDIRSVVPIGPVYTNHNAVIEAPTNIEFMAEQERHRQTHFFRINSDYMYDANEYYDFTKNIDHRAIPSVYLSSDNMANTHEIEYYTPFSRITNAEKITNFDEKMAPFYTDPDSSIIQKYSNFFFGSNYSFGFGNSNLSEFPWHNKVAFSAPKEQKILNSLRSSEVDLYDKIVKDHIDFPKTSKLFELNGYEQDVNVVDLMTLINSGNSTFLAEQMIFLPKQPKYSRIEEASARWAASLNAFSIGLQSIRTIEDMYDEHLCDYEYLYFKVEKFIGTNTNIQPVQVYYISDANRDVLLMDTQVKPREAYTYVVTAYVLMYGSEYQYELLSQANYDGNTVSDIVATIKPSLKIVEVPFFQHTAVVTKKPPIAPFVKFINKSNSSNRIRILLDLQRGEERNKFISITEDDRASIPLIMGAAEDQPVEFEYSKQAGKFQVFKSYAKITDYSRFDSAYTVQNNKGLPHVVIAERVLPNEKYYFFFRTINKFNLPSNPSPIYEVELLKDSDDSKLVVRTVKIESDEDDTHQNDLKFGQFMHLKPAFSQVQVQAPDVFDYETHRGYLPSFSLGYSNSPIWGRKFKFRITSNNTGRKIDFNLIFDIVKRESEENLK